MDIWETFGREAKTQKPPEVTTFFIGAKSGAFYEKNTQMGHLRLQPIE